MVAVLTTSIEQAEAQTSSTNSVAVYTPPPQPTQAGGTGLRRAIRTSDGTVYHLMSSIDLLQDGAQGIWKILPIVEKIGQRINRRPWVVSIGGGAVGDVAGNAIWHELTKTWALPPGVVSNGTIQAIALIDTWKVDGETTHWHTKSGEWAWPSQWGFNAKNPLPPPSYPVPGLDLHANNNINSDNYDRDYQYFDFHCQIMMWDADNEIWTPDPDGSRHHYGHNRYAPSRVNRAFNSGEPGWKYPVHEDYIKGKEGWFIWVGDNVKNYLSHEFKSIVSGEIKNADLKAEAEKEKRTKSIP